MSPKSRSPGPFLGSHQLWRVAEGEPVPGEAGVQALVLVLWRHQWAPSETDCLWSSDRATRLAEHSPTGCSSRRRGTPSHLPRLSTFGSHPAGNGAGTATSYASEPIRITGAETMPRGGHRPQRHSWSDLGVRGACRSSLRGVQAPAAGRPQGGHTALPDGSLWDTDHPHYGLQACSKTTMDKATS